MKRTFLVFALLVVLGFVGYSLSFTEANVTSPVRLKVVEPGQALIGISTSAFTATEQQMVNSELASPTDAEAASVGAGSLQESRAIASDTDAPQTPACAEIKGALIVTNNMSVPFTVAGLRLNESDIACLYPSEKYLPAGESALFTITFMGDPAAVRTLTGELLGNFGSGTVRIGFNLPVLADELILQSAPAVEGIPPQP